MSALSMRCWRHMIPWGLVLMLCPVLALGAGEPRPVNDVAAILVEARRALAEDRLTLPTGHNAVAYAQQVLDLASGHPEAQRILRAVVERYGLIASAAVDRAETLRARELARAEVYRSRGEGVARRYAISPRPLDSVAERLKGLPDRANAAALGRGRYDRATLTRLVDAYRDKGEVALQGGELREARRYSALAGQIARDHRVANPRLAALEGRITAAERERDEAVVVAAPAAGGWVKAVFIPPSF